MAPNNIPAADAQTATPMSEQQLAEIRARDVAATDGPWRVERDEPSLTRYVTDDDGTVQISFGYVGNRTEEEADFVAHARTDVPALLAEVDRLRLTPHERLILRFALEMADDAIASNPTDFTDQDTAAMAKLRALSTGPTVAYRNPWQPGVLLCVEHGEGWEGMKPLSVEDLPNGGTCTAGDPANPDDVCGRNVLAAEAGDQR